MKYHVRLLRALTYVFVHFTKPFGFSSDLITSYEFYAKNENPGLADSHLGLLLDLVGLVFELAHELAILVLHVSDEQREQCDVEDNVLNGVFPDPTDLWVVNLLAVKLEHLGLQGLGSVSLEAMK